MSVSNAAAQPRAIVVQDISCVGRCSLTVALPVLSAAGVNTAVVPTALLSTHTGEFTGYTHLDLSGQLLPIARHIETLGLHFDAFYSGYLATGAHRHLARLERQGRGVEIGVVERGGGPELLCRGDQRMPAQGSQRALGQGKLEFDFVAHEHPPRLGHRWRGRRILDLWAQRVMQGFVT